MQYCTYLVPPVFSTMDDLRFTHNTDNVPRLYSVSGSISVMAIRELKFRENQCTPYAKVLAG